MLDPKPQGRIRNPELLKRLHLKWRDCCLCGAVEPLSLHHLNRHPRDDVEGNLVMLCGSGTTGHHGLIEERNHHVSWLLAYHIHDCRPDTIAYLDWRFPEEGALAWLRRIYGA